MVQSNSRMMDRSVGELGEMLSKKCVVDASLDVIGPLAAISLDENPVVSTILDNPFKSKPVGPSGMIVYGRGGQDLGRPLPNSDALGCSLDRKLDGSPLMNEIGAEVVSPSKDGRPLEPCPDSPAKL